MDLEKLKQLIARHEDERAELKEWKGAIPFDGANEWKNRKCLIGYCVAIGNEGGGHLIVGVDNQKNIVGTSAPIPNAKSVFDRTGQKIISHEIYDETNNRILVVEIPPRGIGQLFKFAGVPLMRVNESLEAMSDAEQRRILLEGVDDFSARPCAGTTIADLDPLALAKLKELYQKKHSNNKTITTQSDAQFLVDVGLVKNNVPTYAALILLGSEATLKQHLANAEISFEYRNRATDIPYNDRVDYRKAFVLSAFEIWEKVSSRQQVYPIIQGFLRREIPAFNEEAFREALFNAVCHRDYTAPASVTILQSPEYIEVTSPGGFPHGVSLENILTVQSTPRNRLLAEVFQKVFLGVERSGQGADKIFRLTIEEGKGTPDYAKSDAYHVTLVIPAALQDQDFVLYLEKIANEQQITLSLQDMILLEKIRSGVHAGVTLKTVKHLLHKGLIEIHGKTRGAQYILSRRFYSETGKLGERTKRIGLSRNKNKELILEHLKKHGEGTTREFMQIFPELEPLDIANLLAELKRAGKIVSRRLGPNAPWQLMS
ncbi:hypothetical protein KBD61_04985 [Patescibacteria group bacterium]|nr:hypothetical protein [Patescibacteria group bacterium]